MPIPSPKTLLSISLLLASIQANAAPVYQPFGSNITFGDVTNSQSGIANSINPAAGASIIDFERSSREDGESVGGGVSWNVSTGVEYGDVQDIFDRIDALAQKYRPSDPDDGADYPGQLPGQKPPGGISIGDIIDINFPEFRPALEAAAVEIASQAAVLALIEADAYATAAISSDLNFMLARGFLGGTWSAGISWSGAGKTYALKDDIAFDVDAAVEELSAKVAEANLTPESNPRLFELVEKIAVTVDPQSGVIKFLVDNDSSLLTKASTTTQLSLKYSKLAHNSETGKLYLGAAINHIELRLSRIGVRFGDITNSEDLFDSYKDLDYKSDKDLSIDIGALWKGQNYQLGASIININEPEFNYPDINLSPYSSETIIESINRDKTYTMERQVKLEGSWFAQNNRLAIHAGLDANSVTDPVGDEFRWATMSGSYSFDSFWVSNLRLGYRKNLTGSDISYLSAGMTAFKYLNLDLASTLKSITVKGSKVPRGIMFSMGLRIDF